MAYKRSKTENEVLRRRARNFLDMGMKPPEIAKNLGVHRSTVNRWIYTYDLDTDEGCRDKPRSGRPTSFTKRDLFRLLDILTIMHTVWKEGLKEEEPATFEPSLTEIANRLNKYKRGIKISPAVIYRMKEHLLKEKNDEAWGKRLEANRTAHPNDPIPESQSLADAVLALDRDIYKWLTSS